MIQEQFKQDPLNSKISNELKNVQIKINEKFASRWFKLTAKKYYCMFHRSDIDPPEKVSEERNNQIETKKAKNSDDAIPVNLNGAATSHKLQGVTKSTSLFITGHTHMVGNILTIRQIDIF